MSMAPNQDDIQINLTVNVEHNDAINKLEQVKDAVDDTARSAQKPSGDFREMGRAMREMGQEFQVESAPIRSISWDLMLTGRSISIVNAAFGNNQNIKQFVSLMYAAAAITRMFVMAYDAQRIATERTTGKGYKAGHRMERQNPFDYGFHYNPKRSKQENVAPEIAPENIGLRAAEVSLGSFRRRTQYRQDKPASKNDVAGQVKSSALDAVASGAIQSFIPKKGKRGGGKPHQEGIFADTGEAITTIGGLLSMIPGGQIPGLALMASGGLASLAQYEKGGVIPRNMPIMAHKGEALVREKDFHAVNQLLNNFSKPVNISQDSMQPRANLPTFNNTTNNRSEDIQNFINIDMHTGNIGNNVDVQKMLKQMAQQMALESRRRTGK